MHLLALLGLLFSDPAIGPSGGGAPVLLSPQVSSGPIFFVPIHKPSHFTFTTTVKDDGEGKGGGWQEAKASLPFGIIRTWGVELWSCPITIGMPIRHSKKGYISPDTAATNSAAVTNNAASNTDFSLPQGVFCIKFRQNVETAFPNMYPVGAKVGL